MPLQLTQSSRLEDVYKTISAGPLLLIKEFKAFYSPEPSKVRGSDRFERMIMDLGRAFGGLHYKALFMGHKGVGKSTELTGILERVKDQYSPIRFEVDQEFDPLAFQPFDILLWMISEMVQKTAKPIAEGGAGIKPSDSLLRHLWDWFATEEDTTKRATQFGAEVSAGIGVDKDSWWAKILGLFASTKGEYKFASVREEKKTKYRLSQLSSLIDIANRLLDECNAALHKSCKKEWILIGENFDKEGIPQNQIENFFITYANVFRSLRAHMIFNVPIALGYSEKAGQLPVPADRRIIVPDVPVYKRENQYPPDEKGRAAARAVLEARVSPQLFAPGQMERLVVASGGNPRDLFSLVAISSDKALIRKKKSIEKPEADEAISELRISEFKRRLGSSPYDPAEISYDKKAERLLTIYRQEPKSDIPDAVLFSLLRSRAIQEFNGERWFGVHPMVVDILAEQGEIPRTQGEPVPGGTI
ncbi:MAG: hypothetical protein NTX50_11700 [Candidatus Sumerlaeota bacterium]|nr:hypothetical protein [Candidatus Sumerlaeota bacterium]